MSGFRSSVEISPVDGRGRLWRVDEDLVFDSGALGRSLTVPAGFVCDLNSLPRILWIVSPKTDYPAAGALHDWGYRGNLTKSEADTVYREALAVLGAGPVRRTFRYWAVKLFGGSSYQEAERRAA